MRMPPNSRYKPGIEKHLVQQFPVDERCEAIGRLLGDRRVACGHRRVRLGRRDRPCRRDRRHRLPWPLPCSAVARRLAVVSVVLACGS